MKGWRKADLMPKFRCFSALLVVLSWNLAPLLAQQKNLTQEQQTALLSKRTSGAVIGTEEVPTAQPALLARANLGTSSQTMP